MNDYSYRKAYPLKLLTFIIPKRMYNYQYKLKLSQISFVSMIPTDSHTHPSV